MTMAPLSMDPVSILTGSSVGGFLLVLGYVCKQLLDSWREHRLDTRTEKTSAITDAATANAILGRTIETLQAENARMAKKVKHLEDEAEAKDRKIDELEARLNVIAAELAALKTGH